jgi:monovalent cation:proton antiporter-2 (CPA2) family protein
MPFLYTLVILLTAAIIAVPLSKRFGFGSVIGYLAAGLLIGPGLGLVRDDGNIAQVSELGVVMLLFLIGLEIRPQRLWVMRRSVLGMGTAQVTVTTALLCLVARGAGLAWPEALVLGFAFSLSSTAIVLPMLAERDLLATHAGRSVFGVLLFQDIAVIPAVVLIPLLHGGGAPMTLGAIALAVLKAGAALSLVLIGGRFLIRPIFHLVDRAKTPEIFTATALVIVIGTASLVELVGLSMSLGAFMAGLLLSDSEYRHELKADIEPFEGLLLGIFFISVGMAADLNLFAAHWLTVLGVVAGLILVKAVICVVLARLAKREVVDALRFGLALAQGGEFGFVILSIAVSEAVMPKGDADLARIAITLSMIATPLLFSVAERWLIPILKRDELKPFDELDGPDHPIIICGFGRVGQIVGRVLRLRGLSFTALDKSAEQVELVRRFGTQAYYGDPTRVDLLRAAGAESAEILVVALDDIEESLKVIDNAQRHFPHLTILARARNRRHVHLLMDRGITNAVRETFHSSLRLTEQVLHEAGVSAAEAQRIIKIFEEHDERTLHEQHAIYQDEKQLIQTTRQVTDELRGLLEADRDDAPDTVQKQASA